MFARVKTMLGVAILLALSAVSLLTGVGDLYADQGAANDLVSISRLPRTLAATITGASLAVCGVIMQMMVRNRFVEPMTVGTGQGAALGILIATALMPQASLLIKMCVASLTALLSSVVFLMIVRRLPNTQQLMVPVIGLVYGGIVGALVVFFAYQADMLQYIEIWVSGEFSGVLKGRYELLWIAAAIALATYFIADQFAILGLGQSVGISLGLNYTQVMVMGLLCVSIVAALTVVTVGMIPFVGLLVPNIISRHYGDNLRKTLPLNALAGAVMVLGCDILGRLLRYPAEVPVGTIFGVAGAFIFLALLYNRPRSIAH